MNINWKSVAAMVAAFIAGFVFHKFVIPNPPPPPPFDKAKIETEAIENIETSFLKMENFRAAVEPAFEALQISRVKIGENILEEVSTKQAFKFNLNQNEADKINETLKKGEPVFYPIKEIDPLKLAAIETLGRELEMAYNGFTGRKACSDCVENCARNICQRLPPMQRDACFEWARPFCKKHPCAKICKTPWSFVVR